ncbi:MAG: lysine 5,6-aminomutase subunit alpha [Armatimonadetes bacterium]|nr:lysine 5,6-aminomutase subunit alpha [Armatimonadota bacterium]
MKKLFPFSQSKIEEARDSSARIVDSLIPFIEARSTASVERAILRLLGVDKATPQGQPWANVIVEKLLEKDLLGDGVAYWVGQALLEKDAPVPQLAEAVVAGRRELGNEVSPKAAEVQEALTPHIRQAVQSLESRSREREAMLKRLGEGPSPLLYVIVATGNIHEDIVQAKSAVMLGADCIAVIRSTGQSLMDYVPHGSTTEGYGGTYATQENFRLMRQAMDEAGEEAGRYVRLVNYSSGLCMPEIAAIGALERLDMMLNDSMYGILFRDINMQRTFVDQYFSRMILAFSDMFINTGEDNYLTTADAYEQSHTVIASQLINEQFALRAGMKPARIGLGHAFEMNPDIEDGLLWEIAQAELVRQIFPQCPIKYMPPTKYMTGNIFKGHLLNAMFNMTSILTGQSIHLVGILTEALHTPFMHDRYLALENARYIFNSARHLRDEIVVNPSGRMVKRAEEVLDSTVELLREIRQTGLMKAIEKGAFAEISRNMVGGKGLEGVFVKTSRYLNPFVAAFSRTEASLA